MARLSGVATPPHGCPCKRMPANPWSQLNVSATKDKGTACKGRSPRSPTRVALLLLCACAQACSGATQGLGAIWTCGRRLEPMPRLAGASVTRCPRHISASTLRASSPQARAAMARRSRRPLAAARQGSTRDRPHRREPRCAKPMRAWADTACTARSSCEWGPSPRAAAALAAPLVKARLC